MNLKIILVKLPARFRVVWRFVKSKKITFTAFFLFRRVDSQNCLYFAINFGCLTGGMKNAVNEKTQAVNIKMGALINASYISFVT